MNQRDNEFRTTFLSEESIPVTILIIESRASLRRALRNWLEVMFAECYVLEATDMAEAITTAQAGLPQVIIVDLGFPNASDLEAIAQLKALVPVTQIVILANYEDQIYRSLVTVHGASAYIAKNALLNQLQPTLTALLLAEAC